MGVPVWRTKVSYVPQRAGLMAGTPMEYWTLVLSFNARKGESKLIDDPVRIGLGWNLPQRSNAVLRNRSARLTDW